MPKDVTDLKEWHGDVCDFNNFAKTNDAKFEIRRIGKPEDGKEMVIVSKVYRPLKTRKA